MTTGSVCAIGGFDGVHRGHQEVIKRIKSLADAEKKAGIITFSPLPIFVLKAKDIFYLTPEPEKEGIFQDLGIDFIYYISFTRDFAEMCPEGFVEFISAKIAPSVIVVGENFHFGKERKGTTRILKEMARDRFMVEVIPKIKDESTISSTRIRELLLLGNIRAANNLLGREYSLQGRVIKGQGKGTRLGFPTINIEINKDKLLPLDGVYKVKVQHNGEEQLGGMFCRHDLIEVHILNFSGDLYDKEVGIKIIERFRDIKEFADDKVLKNAIARDIQKVSK